MNEASLGSDLFMGDAEFADVNLAGAQIGAQLSLIGAKVTGTLNMAGANIGGPLFMRENTEFAEVFMRAAKIGGQLDMTDARSHRHTEYGFNQHRRCPVHGGGRRVR